MLTLARKYTKMPTTKVPHVIMGSAFVDRVVPLIAEARSRIDIVIFDWRLYPKQPTHPVSRFTDALKDAGQRNVKVRVLVANDGVKDALNRMGFEAKNLHSQRMMHVKMMLIDKRFAIIGSHNYTQNAFTENLEISLAVDLGNEENELTKYFQQLWPL